MNIFVIIILCIFISFTLIAIPFGIFICIRKYVYKKRTTTSDFRPNARRRRLNRSPAIRRTFPEIHGFRFQRRQGFGSDILDIEDSEIVQAQSLTTEDYKLKCDLKLVEYRAIQNDLIEQPYSPPFCPLLICVDANPKYIGGYCINFDTEICYTYTFPIEVLPWYLHNKSRIGDSAEFEMKNLMFALLLWEDQIKACGHVQIYTDNSAIKIGKKNMYGERASNFIQHLIQCEGVKTNKNYDVHVNGELYPKEFAKYILPADDLSRWRIKECQDFITNVYQIYKFQGTHIPKLSNSPHAKAWNDKTPNYHKFIETVKGRLNYWRKNPCLQCGFLVGSTESLCISVGH